MSSSYLPDIRMREIMRFPMPTFNNSDISDQAIKPIFRKYATLKSWLDIAYNWVDISPILAYYLVYSPNISANRVGIGGGLID